MAMEKDIDAAAILVGRGSEGNPRGWVKENRVDNVWEMLVVYCHSPLDRRVDD
jgi:hypothetical protein